MSWPARSPTSSTRSSPRWSTSPTSRTSTCRTPHLSAPAAGRRADLPCPGNDWREARDMEPTPQPAVTARGLRKTYGEHVVLDGIDLDVAAGSVLALLGPNGAGKTTMVKILSTLLPADGGTARVAGADVGREPDAVRAAIGVTGQFSAV